MARTRRALAVPSSRGWRLTTVARTFRGLHRLTVILSLRRIRDPSARRHELRILRLRSQARFAQDDTELAKDPRRQALDTTRCGSFAFARRLASLPRKCRHRVRTGT